MKPKYKNVLLKLSGEALGNKEGTGLDPKKIEFIAKEIKEIQKIGMNVTIVTGAGNIFRGGRNLHKKISKSNGDMIGMEATNINALILQESFNALEIKSIALSALGENKSIESYTLKKAQCYFNGGYVVICSGGTGNPFFSTDTASVLRALELNCDVVLKATKVDGVYSDDPKKNKKAKKYTKLSFKEAISENLRIMDQTAFSLAQEYNLPIIVFNMNEKDAIKKALTGKNIGTIIS